MVKKKVLPLITIILVIGFAAFMTWEAPTQEGLKTFRNAQEFSDYVQSSQQAFFAPTLARGTAEQTLSSEVRRDATGTPKTGGEEAVERYSETNVQVTGIDEPDIVKTDGENVYYSTYQDTKIIDAFPAENMSLTNELSQSGDLLVTEDKIIVLSREDVKAFNKEALSKEWEHDFNGSLVTARLMNNKIYLVTKTTVNQYSPCPIHPIGGVTVRCAQIYRPAQPMQVDSTYHVISVDEDGTIIDSKSFVGKSGKTVVYMSGNNVYVTYETQKTVMTDFILEETTDLFPATVINRVREISGYDISDYSKQNEIQSELNSYYSTLSEDDRETLETRVYDRLQEYLEENKRRIIRTGVVRVSVDQGALSVDATTEVPGSLLNQFAMSEYDEHLRLATTVGLRDTENDVYVLGSQDLNLAGKVEGLGVDERIYSARFIGDKAYLVTFKTIDPFYVLDLSNPSQPEVKGELKIPGYSSYLHPLGDNKILGVGREDTDVKISVFDVSNAENPVEEHKFVLDEYWSEVLNNHHAFMLDSEHEIFFIPGGRGAYFFDYSSGLELEKTISVNNARRALYINDVVYVVSYDAITAVSETSWEVINELEVETTPIYRTTGGAKEPVVDTVSSEVVEE